MKKILALAAAAAFTAGVSVYAANPFSDVSTDDWAYQAVSDLSDQGVVEGYPDGTFKGERNMTRYELAQIIARLMAKEDQLNAQQQATLDKLANEYADELANLGVRVSNLEKKVGNISWSGDARMQYQRNRKTNINLDKNQFYNSRHEDNWNGRMRINVQGQVNDQVTVKGRFLNEMNFKDSEFSSTSMDKLHVVYQPTDKLSLDIGRTGVGLSQTGIFMDEDNQYDGIIGTYNNGKFSLSAGYGRVNGIYDSEEHYLIWNNNAAPINYHNYENWFVKASGNIANRVNLSAFYTEYESKNDTELTAIMLKMYGINSKADNLAIWGVGAGIDLGGQLTLDGDYIKHADNLTDKAAMWTAGLTYGEVDTNKVGTWTLGVHYVDTDPLAYLGGISAWDMTDQLEYSMISGAKFWQAKAGVAVAKNVELDAYYYFAGKAKNEKAGNREFDDPSDTFGVELNYTF